MPQPFFIFGLPRSRTTWLATFMSHQGWVCCHDPIVEIKDVTQLKGRLRVPFTGVTDTGTAFAAPLYRKWFPDAPIVVVRRPRADVVESMKAQGQRLDSRQWDFLEAALDAAELLDGVYKVNYNDLNSWETVDNLFSFCTGQRMDKAHWEMFKDRNIQIPPEEWEKAKGESGKRIRRICYDLASLQAEVTFQIETWPQVCDELKVLSREHVEEVNADPDTNWAVIEHTARTGALVITTARAGTRLIGYSGMLLSPSWEAKGVLCGYNNAIFISKLWRGYGAAMLRFSIDDAVRRGVNRLILRSGVRGTGMKLAKLYEHMGAVPDGGTYALTVGA